MRKLTILTAFIAALCLYSLLVPDGNIIFPAYPTHASSIIVNSNSDDPTLCSATGTICLRNAITTATSGDTVAFQSGLSSPIRLMQGVLTFGKSLNITGPGGRS